MAAINVTQQGGSANVAAVNPKGISNSLYNLQDPVKYTSLHDFIDEVNAPDIRANLIKTFGDQGITGFLKLTGAVNAAGSADQVTYWEEARLHQKLTGAIKGAVSANDVSLIIDGVDYADDASNYTEGTTSQNIARKGDVLIINGKERGYVSAVNAAGTEVTVKSLLSGGFSAASDDAAISAIIVGNMYAQGTDQPDFFLQSNVVKRTNPYVIVKESYEVSGSQATNIGYIDIGGGDYRWYLKSEADTRQRFLDKREMMMLLGQKVTSTDSALSGIEGTEGYFAALEDRGLVTSDVIGETLSDFGDIDQVIKMMDKNGCPAEYAIYANTDQMLTLDNMIANGGTGSSIGLAGSYGAFNNDKDMAVNLGFQSFARGGYTFHKHSWKLLNDPTLLGASGVGDIATNLVAGVMIPLTTVADPQTGNRAPALEMNYKAAGGYSREMEHWVTGGGVLGFKTDGKDVAKFNYRSECNLVTRAANQHVLIKGASA